MDTLETSNASFSSLYTVLWDDIAGCGQSGHVRRCKSLSTGKIFAIKMLPYCTASILELQAWRACSPHPNVVPLIDVFDTGFLEENHFLLGGVLKAGRFIFVIMENMEGGDLFDLTAQPLTEDAVICVLRQILAAVSHMHSLGYVHGDLKLENVLLEQKGSLHLRIADFGFARLSTRPVDGKFYTLFYVSPEVITSFDEMSRSGQLLPIGCPSDMWSVGVITYMLLTGSTPFYQRSGEHGYKDGKTITPYLRSCVSSGIFPRHTPAWRRLSAYARSFVESLLIVDARLRYTARCAAQHPWLQSQPSTCTRFGIS